MLPVLLRQPVYLTIRNVGSRPLDLFGMSILSGTERFVRAALEDPGDRSWNALIDALTNGQAIVSYPRVGGLSEALVEAALRQLVGSTIFDSLVADGTVTNTTSETDLGSIQVPPTWWEERRSYAVQAAGIVSVVTGEPSVCLRFRLGTTLILSTGNLTLVDQPTSVPWWFDGLMTVRRTGLAGVLMVNGKSLLAVSGMASGLSNPQTVPLDLSVPLSLRVTAQFSAAAVGSTLTLQNLTFGQ